ncbi:hypothetical protein [Phenylobacterium sp.]|uniref:DUF6894 family protein n=1 Tax=Phenylobacterium sp. TaxID=1871053 RepID=UPI0035B471B9
MQTFYFHVQYGEHSVDREGTELPSLQAAQRAAVELLGRMLIDEGDAFWSKPNITVTVEDARGLVLWSIETLGLASPAVEKFA